jgi:hypothetical protein
MKKLKNVKLLYSTNYWDGPICGLCEYKEKYYYFNTSKDDEWDEINEGWMPREYYAYEILPWQLTYELYWHSLFITNVKGAKGKNAFEEGMKDERFKMEEDFYEKRKREYKNIDYLKNKVMGTFTFYERRIV